ncbi:MAG: hypothetical protein A2W30_07055 [Ignavibacteria bacterium RBG_16_36_9]|nr:MAG: hypothetical protein A2W30_07055 [Ignavibacteria bacterium RBG_16_36_9]
MYYRRKILITLLNELGGKVSKLSLQKLLFLLSQSQQQATYHFIPYKFGCYSFQASADLSTLAKYGLVDETKNNYQLTSKENFYYQLVADDQNTIKELIREFSSFNTTDLIKHVYREFPYYAINSTIAREQLTTEEYEHVEKNIPYSNEKILFTIGYEGISVEEYFNRLIQKDIKVLCDVRNFPRSMKFGFSKNQLKKICEGLGIIYIHLPGLGIESDKRKNLATKKDYDVLFNEYKHTTLNSNKSDQRFILELLKKYQRVALTCFESDVSYCHRFHLSNSIIRKHRSSLKVAHL